MGNKKKVLSGNLKALHLRIGHNKVALVGDMYGFHVIDTLLFLTTSYI